MKKVTIIIAGSLVLIGLVMFLTVLIRCDFDFANLSSAGYQEKTYDLTGEVKTLSITTDSADVELLYSTDGSCRVECYEQEKQPHKVQLEDGKLTITPYDHRKWYDYVGIHFGAPKIKVYLPQTTLSDFTADISTGSLDVPANFTFESGSVICSTGSLNWYASVSEGLSLETTTGDIKVDNISVGSLRLSASTGDIIARAVACETDVGIHVSTGDAIVSDLTCTNLNTSGTTGDTRLTNVIASGKLTVRRSTGDVELIDCDGETLSLTTSTGDITGSLLSKKIYITETSTGDVNVPKSTVGGLCEITSSTGDITMSHQEND